MTRTTPQLALPLRNSAPQQQEDVWPSTCDLTCNRPNTGQILSGIGFRTSGPQADILPLDHRGLGISKRKSNIQADKVKVFTVSKQTRKPVHIK
ncbi:hypothetical protein AVEN_53078-1 [Araneus ventricosus]|uniref:Uncharacterized protein n=1 Tax=Araneus ventricosus TaxID=182803 RepID=A0A4Y2LPE5_ARAVE|nr:hypothetical protein AVEN_53078-1 [Araneus ventricosus]